MGFPVAFYGPLGEQFSTYANDERHRAGHRMAFMDGSQFAFGEVAAAGAIAASRLCQSSVPVTDHIGRTPVAAVVGQGAISVPLGATAVVADYYKDGKLVVENGLGAGYEYKIASHLAAALSTTVVINLHPDERLRTALDATSRVSLIQNPLRGVVITPIAASPTSGLVGVSRAAIPASSYGWFQTMGDGPCLQQGALTVGLPLAPSATVAGAVRDRITLVLQIGMTLRNAGDTLIGTVRLAIPGW